MPAEELLSQIALRDRIGAGHFGVVYTADHKIHGQVAVKVYSRLPDEPNEQWTARRSALIREGQHLNTAAHERIVRVIDVAHNASEDRVYLIMELCANGSMEDAYQSGPLQLTAVRDAIRDAALGLRCIHALNLLHRDLKPANLLCGNQGRVLIADFGLVTDELVFGYASAAGYKDHLAPEVWRDGLTSPKSDIWALGMTAYRLIHGHTFYSRMPAPRKRVPDGGFAVSLNWLPHVPDAWQRFIRKSMHDDTDLRFQNADAVIQALGQLPVTPNWLCTYRPEETIWVTNNGNRAIEVVHSVLSPKKHTWVAHSRPRGGKGRTYRLGGSGGTISKRVAYHQLKRFLCSYGG